MRDYTEEKHIVDHKMGSDPYAPICVNCGTSLAISDTKATKHKSFLGDYALCSTCGKSIQGGRWLFFGKIFLILVFLWIGLITLASVQMGG